MLVIGPTTLVYLASLARQSKASAIAARTFGVLRLLQPIALFTVCPRIDSWFSQQQECDSTPYEAPLEALH